jgi:hypothetical protein
MTNDFDCLFAAFDEDLTVKTPAKTDVAIDAAGRLGDPKQALDFILGGSATVTLRSEVTGTRFTYKVTRKGAADGRVLHFVALLNGPDNTADFTFLGTIFPPDTWSRVLTFKHGKRSTVSADASSLKAFDWAFKKLAAGVMPEQLSVFHSGRCCRCNRLLTTPESVARGIGPECLTKLAG